MRIAVYQSDRLFHGTDPQDNQDRPEDLVLVDLHLGRHVVEQRGAEVEAFLRRVLLARIDEQRGAFLQADVDIGSDLVAVLAGDERTHVDTEFYLLCFFLQQLHQRIPGGAHRHHRRDRHAALARRAVGRADQRVGGELEVRIRQHHRVVLRAAQRLHALAGLRRGLVDVPGDRGGSDEGDCLDPFMR